MITIDEAIVIIMEYALKHTTELSLEQILAFSYAVEALKTLKDVNNDY